MSSNATSKLVKRVNVDVNEKLWKSFKKRIGEVKGKEYGALRESIEEAIGYWLAVNEEEEK